jgi:ribosome-binding protein aMBF1 (putative translation factor)
MSVPTETTGYEVLVRFDRGRAQFWTTHEPVLRSARMSLTNIVAQNLRAVRAEKKLSQHVVAKKARVSVSYISMLERGERTPPLETLEVLAKALGVSPLHLFQKGSTGPRRPRRR